MLYIIVIAIPSFLIFVFAGLQTQGKISLGRFDRIVLIMVMAIGGTANFLFAVPLSNNVSIFIQDVGIISFCLGGFWGFIVVVNLLISSFGLIKELLKSPDATGSPY